MTRKVVANDQVTLFQCGSENLLHIVQENLTVHRPIEEHGCVNSIVAQGRNKRVGVPVTMRCVVDTSLGRLAAAIEPGHLRIDSTLIDKHELAAIPLLLEFTPELALENNVRPVLLFGEYRFFYSEIPISPEPA